MCVRVRFASLDNFFGRCEQEKIDKQYTEKRKIQTVSECFSRKVVERNNASVFCISVRCIGWTTM